MYRQCFVAGTKAKTEDGDKNIEEIKPGDKVWSYNPATGETGLKTVKQTFENETEQIVHITITDGKDIEEIDSTLRHPFYVVDYGFKYASELRIGDKVISVSGDIYEVTSVEVENLDTPVKVYNFEVEDWHTYFVSSSGILVHNECITDGNGTTNASTDKKEEKQESQTTTTNSVEGAGGNKDLLPGEGDIGTYKYLVKKGKKGDNITPHHMPSAEYMAKKRVPRNDGLCINMEMPVPGSDGRHRQTDTYGNNMTEAEKDFYYSLSPRDALAYDINNLKKIYKNDGLYDVMRPKLIQYIRTAKATNPELFKKKEY